MVALRFCHVDRAAGWRVQRRRVGGDAECGGCRQRRRWRGASNAPAATSDAGGGGGGGGGLDGLNACQLLTPDEIQGVIGSGVMPGVQQDSTGQTECDWSGTTDQAAAVSLSVATYDDSLWQAGASSPQSKPVSGLGDAAYQGWPTSVTLNIKVKGYEVAIAVVSFSLANTVIDDDDTSLAKIVLPKL